MFVPIGTNLTVNVDDIRSLELGVGGRELRVSFRGSEEIAVVRGDPAPLRVIFDAVRALLPTA